MFTQIFPQKHPLVQYGLSENAAQFCLIRQENGQFTTCFYPKSQFNAQQILEQAGLFSAKFAMIRALPHRYIWRKYLILPTHYDQPQIYRQIIQHLKQALPLSLEQIYFDYQITPLEHQNAQQVIIYALAKHLADPLILHSQTYLDCELHCIQRAFHFLAKESLKTDFKTGYFVENHLLQFQAQHYDYAPFSIQTPSNFTCEKIYGFEQDKLLNQTNIEIISLQTEQSIENIPLYLRALGASLWNTPLV